MGTYSSLLKNKMIRIYDQLEKMNFLLSLAFSYYFLIFIYLHNSDIYMIYGFQYKPILFLLIIPFIILTFYRFVGKIKFDHSLYDIPEIGDIIIITEKFDYKLFNVKNSFNYIYCDKTKITLDKNSMMRVISIRKHKNDFIIELGKDYDILSFFYLDINNKITTKRKLREFKLKEILNDTK